MAVSEDPAVAAEVAQFGEGANPAASIQYDVPLPGAYSFQRVVPIDIIGDWFTAEALNAGTSLNQLGVAEGEDGEIRSINGDRLRAFYQRLVPAGSRPSIRAAADVGVGVVEPRISRGETGEPEAVALPLMRSEAEAMVDQANVEIQIQRRERFLDRLAERQEEEAQALLDAGAPVVIQVPAPGLGQSVQSVDYDVTSAGTPQIAIIETWQLSAFLGDYGLGRTLQTFSLLPGERTSITVETWRSEAATREDASSVFDSSDTAAQSRFTSELALESGSAFQDQGGWAVSVGTKVSAGVNLGIVQGSASLEAGFSANHQEARQQFSSAASQASEEHASQVNASRRQAVQSTSGTTTETGTSQTTARELANTNLRRVLNFVFRELNQEYETITSLRDVQVAFYNGHFGSLEIVPLADLRRLLDSYIIPERQEELARSILALVVECLDYEGTMRAMLEVGTRAGGEFAWTDATLNDDGALSFDDSPLAPQYSWRIKRGSIGQPETEPHKVPGVVTARDSVVLRTDNIVIEALLGQADALDPYASTLQALDLRSREADIEWRAADTRRTIEALDLVESRPEGEQVDAFERMLGDKADIEVVPAVAAVNNDNR
jgi:hypothetical protein